MPTEDQIEAARTKVRNMLHAADHGNHDGEMAVLRMAASGELVVALREADDCLAKLGWDRGQWLRKSIRTALSLAQPYEAEVEKDEGLQTNDAPQCGVGPSDLTGQERKPSSEGDRFIGLTVEEIAERTRQEDF